MAAKDGDKIRLTAEIADLARLFLTVAAKRARRRAPTLSDRARIRLEEHRWPGNVRELRNVMDRALMICLSDVVGPEHILLDPDIPEPVGAAKTEPPRASTAPAERSGGEPAESTGDAPENRGRLVRLDPERERKLIEEALLESAGHQGRAAARLGISRRTLINRLDELRMKRPRKR